MFKKLVFGTGKSNDKFKMFWKHLSCTSNHHREYFNFAIYWEVAILEHMKTRKHL